METVFGSIDSDIFIFDSETTGFMTRQKWPQFTELAIIHLNSGKFFHTLIKPTIKIDINATLVSGINAEMVQDKPEAPEVLQTLISFVNDNVKANGPPIIVAQNGKRFDFNLLNYHLQRTNSLAPSKGWCQVDSLNFFSLHQQHLPKKQSAQRSVFIKNQSDVFRHLFGTSMDGAHAALFDAKGLARILLHLVNYDLNKLENELLLLINSPPHCSCKSNCNTSRCSCKKHNRVCTLLCRKCTNCSNGKPLSGLTTLNFQSSFNSLEIDEAGPSNLQMELEELNDTILSNLQLELPEEYLDEITDITD